MYRSAGVCAPAVKDFATVRNRSAHTTEDAQPRSQTVMTYSEPSPADLESVLEAAPQEFGISHPPLPAAASGSPGAASKYGYRQRPWLTFPRAQIPLDDLAASRWHASGQGHAWPAQDDFHAAGAVARLQETQRKRIDPVHVTVAGEAYNGHGGSRASAERTGGSDARIWWKQHRAQSRDNRPGKRLPLHRGPQPGTAAVDRLHRGPQPGTAAVDRPHRGPQPGTAAVDRPHRGPQPGTAAVDRPHRGPQPGTAAVDRPHQGPQPGPASPSGGCIEGEANRACLTAGPGSASCRLDAA